MSITTPCKDCTKRVIGCHSKCTAYIKYTEERQVLREKSRKPPRTAYEARVRHNGIHNIRPKR